MTVRRATAADADVIAEFNRHLAVESESHVLDADTVARGVRLGLDGAGLARYWLAEAEDGIRGQSMVTVEWSDWRAGPVWWLQSVYVVPEWRGRGVFRALWDHVIGEARQEDVVGLRLYVHHENASARNVYERLGMTDTPYRVYELPFGRTAP